MAEELTERERYAIRVLIRSGKTLDPWSTPINAVDRELEITTAESRAFVDDLLNRHIVEIRTDPTADNPGLSWWGPGSNNPLTPINLETYLESLLCSIDAGNSDHAYSEAQILNEALGAATDGPTLKSNREIGLYNLLFDKYGAQICNDLKDGKLKSAKQRAQAAQDELAKSQLITRLRCREHLEENRE